VRWRLGSSPVLWHVTKSKLIGGSECEVVIHSGYGKFVDWLRWMVVMITVYGIIVRGGVIAKCLSVKEFGWNGIGQNFVEHCWRYLCGC